MAKTLSDVQATTLEKHLATFINHIFTGTFFLAWLKNKGRFKPLSGGERIFQPLLVGRNETPQMIGGYDTFEVKPEDYLSGVYYRWKQFVATLTACRTEELQNAGPERVANLIAIKEDVLERSLREWFNAALIQGRNEENQVFELLGINNRVHKLRSGGRRRSFCGLEMLVGDGPFAEVDPSQPGCEFWKSPILDTSSFDPDTGAPIPFTLDYKTMTEFIGCLTYDGSGPDLILSDKASYYAMKAALNEANRFSLGPTTMMARSGAKGNGKHLSYGFESFDYDGVEWAWDRAVPPNTIYVLNSDHLTFWYHTQDWFRVSPWKEPGNQLARFKVISGAGEFTTDFRAGLGKICNSVPGQDCLPVKMCAPIPTEAAVAVPPTSNIP